MCLFDLFVSAFVPGVPELLLELKSIGDEQIIQLLVLHRHIPLDHLRSFAFLLQILYLPFHLESKLLHILLPLFLEFIKLIVVLKCHLLKVLSLHIQLCLQLIDPASIKFLQSCQLVLQAVIIHGQILILMKQVIDFELSLRKRNLFPTELIF